MHACGGRWDGISLGRHMALGLVPALILRLRADSLGDGFFLLA
jgi:hypothetical protein